MLFFAPGGEETKVAAATPRVIGHAETYLQVGEALGAKVFDVPAKVYKAMTSEERWAANAKFLERGIRGGAEFVLSTLRSEIRTGSTLEKEVNYLLQRGYKWADDAKSLIPK